MNRLWIISELFPPDETSTSYILGEIANACAKEYDVNVICGPKVYDSRKVLDVEHPFALDPAVKVIRADGLVVDKNTTRGKARLFLAMSRRLYRLAKSQIGEGDKVLSVTNPAPLTLLMSRLRRRRRFEWTILVHDVFPENTVPAGLRIPKAAYRYVKRLFDRAYARADRLVALGRDMAEVLREKAGEEVKIEIVENWAEVDMIQPLPFPEGPIRLDKLVNELPEGVELHFYGTGAMEDSLKRKGKKNVFFHGPYFRSRQTDVLGACHAAVVTLAEGMYGLGVPSKAYNIMAAGRPILYFGPPEGEIGLMVKENRIGYSGWPEIWDLAEMEEMGKRARMLAESLYSKSTVLEKFLAAIR